MWNFFYFTGDEGEEHDTNDVSMDSTRSEVLDNSPVDIADNDSDSSVITSESTAVNFSFPSQTENPDLHFYLKNSCDALTKNLNVNADKNCSKTTKELFKVLQQNSDLNSSFETADENVS